MILTNHTHAYGVYRNVWSAGFIGRVSNNSVAPVTPTPGFASITIGINTVPTDPVYVCPKYSGSDITTGIVEDELSVHPSGPANQTNPIIRNNYPHYRNNCLNLGKPYQHTNIPAQQLELYAIQDNVTDADQNITLSFDVISDDNNYNGMSIPNVTVTVENASVPTPAAPLNLKATASGANNLITWQKPLLTGLGEGIQSYTLQWNTDNGSSWTNITGITSDNYTHSGLSSSTNYFYQVFANNQGGAGPVSNRDNITTGILPGITFSATTATVRERWNSWRCSMGKTYRQC